MNLLFLSPIWPYPVEDGDRQRAYHLIRGLARKHTVHFLGFVRGDVPASHLDHMKKICASVRTVHITRKQIVKNCVKAWWGKVPLNVAAYANRAMQESVRQMMADGRIDGIYAYRLRMAPYALGSGAFWTILDYTDAMTRHFENRIQVEAGALNRIYLRHEAKRLRRYEVDISHRVDGSVISSQSDRELLVSLGANRDMEEITNGVDIESVTPVHELQNAPEVIFVGNMAYHPNHLGMMYFFREVWPKVKTLLPGARMTVVGQRPMDFSTNRIWQQPDVEFTGLVPTLAPYMQKARVAVAPLQVASGRQFKVIEYFAYSLPVVATGVVAANVMAEDGVHCLVADGPDAFAKKIIQVCQERSLAEKIRTQARQLAVGKYAWSAATDQLESMISRIARDKQGRRNS